MDPFANLSPQEREAALSEVAKHYPKLNHNQLEAVIAGKSPFHGKEDAKDTNPDVDKCVAFAQEIYDTAVEQAKEIKNGVARAVALILARVALVLAKIKCLDDYGS